MDFLEIATQRFSVRHFLDKKVENIVAHIVKTNFYVVYR